MLDSYKKYIQWDEAIIPFGVTHIEDNAFSDCYQLKSIELPCSIESIGNEAFKNCTSLVNVSLPKSIIEIGQDAFCRCIRLHSIEIPESVKTIKMGAFYSCLELSSVVIPGSVERIGPYAFSACPKLSSIEVSYDNKSYYSLHNCIIEKEREILIQGCVNSKIPDTIKEIGEGAFNGCSELTSIAIPDGVRVIGELAFECCSKLAQIRFPKSLSSIEGRAFKHCTSLSEVVLNDGLEIIDGMAFFGCYNLTSIIIPKSVKDIEMEAFRDCKNLTSIVLPDYITEIWHNTFEGCSSLQTIEIPQYVESIQNGAFRGCTSLTSLIIPNSVKYIGDEAFSGCYSLKRIDIPENVGTIGKDAFIHCSRNLLSINVAEGNKYYYSIDNCLLDNNDCLILGSNNSIIPFGTTIIGRYAFYGCKDLSHIEIPNTVKVIDTGAFQDCSSLCHIELPDSVSLIGSDAFSGCSNLTSLEIPDSIREIGSTAFFGCSKSLSSIKVSKNNQTYTSRDNCLLNKESTVLILGCSKSIIPESVKIIKQGAFAGCSNLTYINIPQSVQLISFDAFSGTALKTLSLSSNNPFFTLINNCLLDKDGKTLILGCADADIPDSVEIIRRCAFSGRVGLTNIYIKDTVKTIEGLAFSNCPDLVSVELGSILDRFCDSYEPFSGCRSLKIIRLFNKLPPPENMLDRRHESNHEGSLLKRRRVSVIMNGGFWHGLNIEEIALEVPIGTGYAYRHHHFFSRFKEVRPIL